jgi:hypothetical protein
MDEPQDTPPSPSGSSITFTPAPDFTVDLGDEERDLGTVTEDELRAKIFGMKADVWLRFGLGVVIAGLFIWLNREVMNFVRDAFDADIRLLSAKPPLIQAADRLVTGNVIMVLIGATATQVGIAIVSIVSYLFPKRPL